MKIFKTKIALITEEEAKEKMNLEELGIDSSIEDDEVKWKDVYLDIDKVLFAEETLSENRMFNVTFIDGTLITTQDNPFEEIYINQNRG